MDTNEWASQRISELLKRLTRQAAAELREEGMRLLEAAGRLKAL